MPNLTDLTGWAEPTFNATGAPTTNRTQYLEETSVTCGTTVYYRPLAAAAIAFNPSGVQTGAVIKQDLVDAAITYGTGTTATSSSLAQRQADLDKLIPCFATSRFSRAGSKFSDLTVTF